ncbi:Transcriptional adapter ada2, partial [Gonapodya sp. JEL0774]
MAQLLTNPRGIPQAPFVSKVEDFVQSAQDAESTLQKFAEMTTKFKFMEEQLLRKRRSLEEKIPEFKNTLDMIDFLAARNGTAGGSKEEEDLDNDAAAGDSPSDTPLEVTYELNDTLWAHAKISKTDTVYLWLGANLMVEYPVEEARTLLSDKLSTAKASLKVTIEDQEFLREQITTMEVTIFDPAWAADEELLLLENLDHYGLGNWEQVAEQLGTKSKEECARHYKEVYVESENFPMPDMSKVFDKEGERRRLRVAAMEVAMSPASKKALASSIKPPRPLVSAPHVHEIAGYMPGRLEFDVEPENNAEDPVKDITFDPEDGPAAVSGFPDDEPLKLALLETFNSRLDMREDRKRMVRELGLLEFRKVTNAERRRRQEERAVYERARVFARCMTAEDFEEWMKGFVAELDLRQTISQLQEWRRMGVRTIEQGRTYEADKAKRVANLRLLGFNVGPVTHADKGPAMGLGGSAKELFKEREKEEKKGVVLGSGGNLVPTPSVNTSLALPTNLHNPPPATSLSAYRSNRPHPSALDISNADGVHLLSPAEQHLCSVLRIMPHPYLVIKEKCVTESARLGGLRKGKARELIKIDVNKTSRIFDAFLEWGWI